VEIKGAEPEEHTTAISLQSIHSGNAWGQMWIYREDKTGLDTFWQPRDTHRKHSAN